MYSQPAGSSPLDLSYRPHQLKHQVSQQQQQYQVSQPQQQQQIVTRPNERRVPLNGSNFFVCIGLKTFGVLVYEMLLLGQSPFRGVVKTKKIAILLQALNQVVFLKT
ncbi:hypothetical protein BD770DRAFT_34231 [Pilaira anomala]|nr:hypothetical protein BD770DRAFT_34231 [Pilaira anomala]